jgi:hypothetical protein
VSAPEPISSSPIAPEFKGPPPVPVTGFSARRFAFRSLGLAGVVVGLIALFNFIVDPYDLYGNNRLGVYITAEREFKSSEVRRYPHNAMLVGNSRMAMIPVQGLEGFRFFNGGFGGGTAEEAYYFLRHYAKDLDVVIIGVELGQGDPPNPQGDIFAPLTWTGVLNNLLSLKTVEYSVRTIYDHYSGEPISLRKDGSFDATRWFERWDKPDPEHLAFVLGKLGQGYWNYKGSSKLQTTYYNKIADTLRERGILCVALIPPLHEGVAEKLRNPAAEEAYRGWRDKIKSIFPVVVDLSVSPYCAATNYFASDPVHFKPEAGVEMLNKEVIPAALAALKKNGTNAPAPRR